MTRTPSALWLFTAALFGTASVAQYTPSNCTGPDGLNNIPCGYANQQFTGNNQVCGVDPSDDSLFEVVYEICPCFGDFYYEAALTATGLDSSVTIVTTYQGYVSNDAKTLYTITQPINFPNTNFLPGSEATLSLEYYFPSSDIITTNIFTVSPMTSIFYSTPTSTIVQTSTFTDSETATSISTSTITLLPATVSTPCITGTSIIFTTQPPSTSTITGSPIIQTSVSVVSSIATYTSFAACPTTNSTAPYFLRREILNRRQSTVEATITPFEQLFCSPVDGTTPSPTTYVETTTTASTTSISTITQTAVYTQTQTTTETALPTPATITVCADVEGFVTSTLPGSQIFITVYPTSISSSISMSISTTTLLLPPTGCPLPTVYVTSTQTICPASSTKYVTATASTCAVQTGHSQK